jgi:hypothetical protein
MEAISDNDKSKVRELAESYVRIEENTEFLTQLKQKNWKQKIIISF